MPEIQNGWFEKHVVEALDRLEKGQASMLGKYEDHVKSDTEQFEAIRLEIATDKATRAAEAKTSAKFWALIGGGISLGLSSAVHFFTKGH